MDGSNLPISGRKIEFYANYFTNVALNALLVWLTEFITSTDMRFQLTIFLIITSSLILNGCSDGSSSDDEMGDFTLNITDSQIDDANEVFVEFTGVTLKPADGSAIEFNFEDDPKTIDLLALAGMMSQPLLDDVEIPAGKYNWIRLHVNAEFDGELDSYITKDVGQEIELVVPSGSQSGLKINRPFTVSAGTTDLNVGDEDIYTIDFDLRKSIVDPGGKPYYFLKPVLRLVQNMMAGSVAGKVSDTFLLNVHCDAVLDTNYAVYIYSGLAVDVEVDDIGSEVVPIATSLLEQDIVNGGGYLYEIGFLEEGDYTIAFTCQSDLDLEDSNDDVDFLGEADVPVVAGEETIHDFL